MREISQRGADIGLNHLGIQVESDAELGEMQSRLKSLQPGIEKEEGTGCCYAKSDKYWVTDPSGIAWETFHTFDSIPVWGGETPSDQKTEPSGCCTPVTVPLMPMKRQAGTCAPTPGQKSASGSCC